MKTWHLEWLFVASILTTVALASGGGWVEILGSGAVLFTFGHASVASRLAEAESYRSSSIEQQEDASAVHCHRWATRYLVLKEILWVAYFAIHGSWSALAGCALFISHPFWRKWYRRRYPINRHMRGQR